MKKVIKIKMPRVAIILLHQGRNHTKSRLILERIEKSGVFGISEIYVKSVKFMKWLMNNDQKLEINTFPSFLVAQEGKRTESYPGNDVDIIISMVNELNS